MKADCEYVKPYHVMVKCNGVNIRMQVDTGTAMLVLSERLYLANFSDEKLQPGNIILKTYTNQPLELSGKM